MLRGGVSDKVGNGFEAVWSMLQMLRLVRDEIRVLHLEPIGVGGGFEFSVEAAGGIEWHQCKRRGPGESWSVAALTTAGYLADIAAKWRADPHAEFRFVSSTPAVLLDVLADKGRLVATAADFKLTVDQNIKHRKAVDALIAATGLDEGDLWCLLQRIHIEIATDLRLETRLSTEVKQLIHGDAEATIRLLRSVLDTSLTHRLTPDQLRQTLIREGLRFRDARIDPTAWDRLRRQNQLHLNSFGLFGVEGRSVPRAVSANIAARIVDDPLLQTIAVTGLAGGGKSGVLRQVAAALEAQSVPCLQIRIDNFLGCATSEELGDKIFGLKESPCRTLSLLAEGRRAVLIVDQLDSISEVAGRQAAAKELIFQLIQDAALNASVSLVVGCRSYDFENDRRFSVMAQGERGLRVEVPPLDFETEILPFMQTCGIDGASLSSEHRTLAQLPLNLVLLIELHRRGGLRDLGIATTTGLYRDLLRRQTNELSQQGVTWSLEEALGVLAQWMSDNEVAEAPEWILDRFGRAVPLLTSLHLLIANDGRIRFFHDTLYDYAFARDFVRQGLSLCDWLDQRAQLLFRRTQVRQVLDLLRSAGHRLYLPTLRALLHDNRVRMHIKDMVVRWLAASAAPTKAELDIILSLDAPDAKPPALVERALAGSAWIGLLVEGGHLPTWLESADEPRRQFAFWLLKIAAEKSPTLVASVLRQWWRNDAERSATLREWMRIPRTGRDDDAIADLYCELIRACPADRFPDDKLPAEAEIGQWAHSGSPNVMRIYATWLHRWFEIHPTGTPFVRHYGTDDSGYWLSQLSGKAPTAFVEAIWPWIGEGMRREAHETSIRHRRYGGPFWRDEDDDDHEHSDEEEGDRSTRRIFMMVRAALSAVARTAPATARALLSDLDPLHHDAACNLHLAAIAANPALSDLLIPLEVAPDVFIAGTNGAEWNAIARTLGACWSALPLEKRELWERKILNYWPELASAREYAILDNADMTFAERRERVKWRLEANGRCQRAILSTIGRTNLSQIARARLDALDRKFPGARLPGAHRMRAGYVRSPIEGEAVSRMKVTNWLAAMLRYKSPEERHIFTDQGPIGGSDQLARVLETWCKERPLEALTLLHRMPSDVPKAYHRAVVVGVASSAAEPLVATEVGKFAAAFDWDPGDNPLPRFAHDKPAIMADEDIFATVLMIAADPTRGACNASSRRSRDPTLEVLVGQADTLAFSGSLTDQGQALEALAAGVAECPERLEQVATLAEALAIAPLAEEVRAVLASVALSIATIEPDRGVQILDRVTEHDALALGTRQGMRLTSWALHQRPVAGRKLLDRLLASTDERLRPAGYWMLGRFARRDDAAAAQFETLWPDSVLARRIAARLAAGWLDRDTPLEPRAAVWLERLYEDPDNAVCQEAAGSGRGLAGPDRAARMALGLRLASSRAFRVDPDDLLIGLRDVAAEYPDVVIAAARAYFAAMDDPTSELHLRGRASGYTLTQTVLAAYRHLENDPKYRRDALDIIDAMVQRDSDGIRDEILKVER